MNRIGKSSVSNRAEAIPKAPEILDFAHFANGNGTISDLVFVNVGTQPVRPTLYFYDTEGRPIATGSIAFSNSRMILKQVWVGKGTEVGSELLSRGFRCGDGEGGGGSSAGLCCEQGNSSSFPLPLPSLKNPGPTGPSPGAVLPP